MQSILLKIILIFSFSGVYSVGSAQLSEEQEKCAAAIDNTYRDIQNMRDRQAEVAANDLSTSSVSQPQNSGNVLTNLVNKIAEGNKQKGELIKQQMEQERQINTEQFKQVTTIEDKLREIEKEKSRLPIEIQNARFERKKQEADIRMKCQARAQQEYDKLIETNSTLSRNSQYSVGSLSQVRGTRGRMRSQRKLFYNRCINDPTTLEALQLAIDEEDSKLYKFTIQSGIHNADLEYTKSKIPKLLAHMDENRRYVAQSVDVQMQTLDQQMQMEQMQLMYAVFTSGMNSNGRQVAAASFNSADQILTGWENLRVKCANHDGTGTFFEVPSDMIGYFAPVNRYCRPASVQDPSKSCIRSNNSPSVKPTRNGVTS